MKFTYWSEKSDVDKKVVDNFLALTKSREIIDISGIDKIILSKFSKVTFIIGKDDTNILTKLTQNKLDRSITVITKDMSLIPILSMYVSKMYILDYTTESMPSYWLSPVSDYENMVNLFNHKLRAVVYEVGPKDKGIVTYMSLNSKEINGINMSFITVREMSNTTAVSYIKGIIREENKNSKKLIKEENQIISDRNSTGNRDLKLSVSTGQGTSTSIEDYLVSNNYISKDNLKKEVSKKSKGVPIEQHLCSAGYFSKEDLVSILNNFLNQVVYGREDFRRLRVEYITVIDTLKAMGVIEAYKIEDVENLNKILIIPYDCDRKLVATINSTVNYSSLVLTLPDYMEEFK